MHKLWFFSLVSMITLLSVCSCDVGGLEEPPVGPSVDPDPIVDMPVDNSSNIADIDLSNWKVTLPVGDPTEVEPPEILDYANNPLLKDFMYDDTSDASLVFYTYPGETTQNSSYSRTELREQLVPGSNSVNWKFSDTGIMEGELALKEISKDASGKFHRTMVMQIHGRLSNAQRDLRGESSNNAPPVLKVYWQNGRVRVVTKVLKNGGVSDTGILKKDAWTDGEGHYFEEVVNNAKFKVKIEASFGKMSITLNDSETKVYESSDLERWDVFENYFKAGNYLQTTDAGAFARVHYYSLEVKH